MPVFKITIYGNCTITFYHHALTGNGLISDLGEAVAYLKHALLRDRYEYVTAIEFDIKSLFTSKKKVIVRFKTVKNLLCYEIETYRHRDRKLIHKSGTRPVLFKISNMHVDTLIKAIMHSR